MNEERIERILLKLENREISEDESEVDEDNLEYNENVRDLRADLEDETQDEVAQEKDAHEEADMAALDPEDFPENSTSSVNYGNARNLIWKKKNMAMDAQALRFLGVTESILDLSSPYQFFSYFLVKLYWRKLLKNQIKSVSLPCPKAIHEYNAHMGDVDSMDSYLGRYRIRM